MQDVASIIAVDEDLDVHQKHVMELCILLCDRLDTVSEEDKRDIAIAARNHDIGKRYISEEILNVPRKLDDYERKIVDMHSFLGFSILKSLGYSDDISSLVLLHHGKDKYNGGIEINDERILWLSNIIRICDIYDALTSDRVYRRALSKEEALEILNKDSGIPDDLKFVFNELIQEVVDV